MIVQDHVGQPLLMAWRVILNCKSAEEAEVIACLDGVRLVERWPDLRITLETDRATVVTKINGVEPDRSMAAALIEDMPRVRGGQSS